MLGLVLGVGLGRGPAPALADEVTIITADDPDDEGGDEGDDGEDPDPEESDSSSSASSSSSSSSKSSSSKSSASEESQKSQESVDPEEEEEPDRGGIFLQVIDYDLEKAGRLKGENRVSSQGDATVQGMVFNVYNEKNKLVCKMVTDVDGVAATEDEYALAYGTYVVKQDAESAKKVGYNPNSTWVSQGKKLTVDLQGEYAEAGTCPCEVIRGAVRVNQVDSEMYDVLGSDDRAQGKAHLEDAVYEIFNASSKAVMVNGTAYDPYVEGVDYNEPIMELTTDEFGDASTDGDTGEFGKETGLPWGTYVLRLKTPSKGFHVEEADKDAIVGQAEVRGAARYDTQDVIRATATRGGAKIKMVDAETPDGKPQGDASLKGMVFEIVCDSGENSVVIMDGKAFKQGDVLLKLTTNKAGIAKCATDKLPYGKYKVRMSKDKSSRSYVYDKDWNGSLTVKKNGKRAKLAKVKSYAAKIVRGGVTVTELVSGSKRAATGSKVQVVNASDAAVIVEGKSYAKGKVVLELSPDDEGKLESAKNVLPYGTYKLRESQPSEGCQLNKDWNPSFQVRKNAKLVDAGVVYDAPSPELTKMDDTQQSNSRGVLPILPIIVILLIAAGLAAGIVMLSRRKLAGEEAGVSIPAGGRRNGAAATPAKVTPAPKAAPAAAPAPAPKAAPAAAAVPVAAAAKTVAADAPASGPRAEQPRPAESRLADALPKIASDDLNVTRVYGHQDLDASSADSPVLRDPDDPGSTVAMGQLGGSVGPVEEYGAIKPAVAVKRAASSGFTQLPGKGMGSLGRRK